MSLRTRMTLLVLLLVLGATFVMGVASYSAVRSSAYSSADALLVHMTQDLAQGHVDDPGLGGLTGGAQNGNGDRFNPAATGVAPSGTTKITWVQHAGFNNSQYPPPILSADELTAAQRGPIVTSDPLPYRVSGQAAIVNGQNYLFVFAVPVTYEYQHLHKIATVLLIGALLVSLLGALLAWLLVRRSLKPVDTMIEVASDIAKGDLERRVPTVKEGTELAKLGASLNAMISSMQTSLHEREESEQTMRRFLGDASHELRTPLTVIRGYTELLGGEQQLDEAQIHRAIQRLDTESARMETLVVDLLNLARLDEHRPLTLRPVDFAQVTRDALEDLKVQQPEREIVVETPPVAIVNGDETKLRQLLGNLVGNIAKYTPSDSSIVASVTIADNQKWHDDAVDVVLTLDDSGPGIPADQRELARQRFGRLDSSRARATGGFGLGLSIVDAIVQAHDGEFTLAESPTRGLRVVVRLPVEGPEVAAEDAETPTASESVAAESVLADAR